MTDNNIIQIKYSRPLLSVQDIVRYIDKGEEYSKSKTFISDEKIMEYLGAIILNPTYQREYRSTVKEESLIMESILLDIPIPEVFLVRVPKNEIQVKNVMDGRHRLNAIYRFVKGKYKLQGLNLIEKECKEGKYNGKSFFDLSPEDKIKILTYKISVLEFDELSNDKIERELFTRYNKATKPLEQQEIRYATYASKTSQYVTSFINNLKEDKNNILYKAYNITKSRSEKQKIHQNIFVILHIIEKGLNVRLTKSTELADEYMKMKNNEYKNNCESPEIEDKFNKFNEFIAKIAEKREYPFSSRLYTEKTGPGSYLFQIGIAMVLSSLYYYCNINTEENYEFIEGIRACINDMIEEDQAYGGFSTNSRILAENIIKVSSSHYKGITFNEERINQLKIDFDNRLNGVQV